MIKNKNYKKKNLSIKHAKQKESNNNLKKVNLSFQKV